MNTRSKTTWALALAAIPLSLTSACGSELAPPAQDLSGVKSKPQAPGLEQGTARLQHDDVARRPLSGLEQGTARLQHDDAVERPMSGQWWERGSGNAPVERNLARKDFNDNGGA